MTNREYINNLSDEELADCIINDDLFDMPCEEQSVNKCSGACLQCVVKWLSQEVEENSKKETL